MPINVTEQSRQGKGYPKLMVATHLAGSDAGSILAVACPGEGIMIKPGPNSFKQAWEPISDLIMDYLEDYDGPLTLQNQ